MNTLKPDKLRARNLLRVWPHSTSHVSSQLSSEDGRVLYFGQEDIHTALTLDQMHELAAAHPPVRPHPPHPP